MPNLLKGGTKISEIFKYLLFRSLDQKQPDCSFMEDNPFGFTPYDSGKMIGNYGFKEEAIKLLKEVKEEKRNVGPFESSK